MMDNFQITLTKAGLGAIIRDDGPGFITVVIAQIGLTDAEFTVASTLTALPGEFKRLDVSGQQVGDDIVHMVALDASDDAYTYRGFALYLSDGTLFGAYGQSGPIAAKAQPSATHIVVDIHLSGGMADAISFGDTNFLNPPATTTRQGVVELATVEEAAAGLDPLRAITPATAYGALLEWLRGRNISVGLIDAYTPNIGTTGAVRILANGQTGKAILQCLNVDGSRQLGYLLVDDTGAAQWHGGPFNADLLGGHDAGWFADIVSRLGYVPFDSAGFTGAAVKAVLGYTPQDAADFSFGSNANGYWRRMPGGLIEQWGEVTAGETGSPPALNFPISFTDLASINLQVTARAPNIGATNGNKVGGNRVSLTQFNVFSDDLNMDVFWRAIGK
ncbi:hypothetical protein [Novosphingobium sp. SG707]|uniref:gp53-like domain-containing protein n=1 Tax=Novosphingobium sp. SG707 TaxID=2586996 RepID=UPI00180FCD31|nr:hypothetical protein [Novosphingobium sp. SG707]NKJ02808.1 hypothetical protein [Novosphingobium sp. SG707]